MVREGGVGHDAHVYAEIGKRLAGEVALVCADERGEHLVGIDDVTIAVAMDDQIAEGIDQAAKTLLALLHLPHAVGERLDLGAAAGGGLVQKCRGAAFGTPVTQMHGKAAEARGQETDGDEGRCSGEMRQPGQHGDGDDHQERQAFTVVCRQCWDQRRRDKHLPLGRVQVQPVIACGLAVLCDVGIREHAENLPDRNYGRLRWIVRILGFGADFRGLLVLVQLRTAEHFSWNCTTYRRPRGP